ncbi:hypothetical protein M2282_000080 [Variovorax boronicumulans]|uniref:hypothetical protein n=1 Tax=Variovorax boronicumulans TaxID=436515 RepID=UPI0024743B0F|nr:hypothetical protein [Variovorax boronicumulans]MDH6164952.1 hypothetical protein [Variovorax boronicumulans]
MISIETVLVGIAPCDQASTMWRSTLRLQQLFCDHVSLDFVRALEDPHDPQLAADPLDHHALDIARTAENLQGFATSVQNTLA